MQDVYIIGAARTPIGSFRATLASMPATELGKIATRASLDRAKIDPKSVQEVRVAFFLENFSADIHKRIGRLAVRLWIRAQEFLKTRISSKKVNIFRTGFAILENQLSSEKKYIYLFWKTKNFELELWKMSFLCI